jgi:RNA polymerase sigma factor (sigma-70 family)
MLRGSLPEVSINQQFDPEEIVQRILAGDTLAEEDLILRFQPAIRAFVNARARADLVDEVTQETMMATICAVREGKLRNPASLAAFVYGIARLQLADATRRYARHSGDPLPADLEQAAPAVDPDLVTAARREIENLNETDRRILSLTLIDGFHAGEIADELGMSADLIRKRKSRALQRITERLAPRSRFGSGSRLSSIKAI